MIAEGRIQVPNDACEARLRDTIARMLRPSPAERYQSAKDVRQALLAPNAVSSAITLRGGARLQTSSTLALAATPRAIDGAVKERFESLSYPWWRISDSSAKDAGEGYGIVSIGVFGLLCVLTAGIMPAIFIGIARDRRRRLRRFFAEGTPAVAEITAMRDEPTAFGAKMTRVNYDFEADGEVRRDSDLSLPVVADRWKVGDRIEVLYLPERDYDSVIVSPG